MIGVDFVISIIVLTIIFFLFLFIILRYFKIQKDIIFCFFITILTCLFFYDMNSSLESIKKGVQLCFSSIFPSIFSFSLICNLLISFNGIELYSKYLGNLLCRPFRVSFNCSFILIASFLCGYPLGAKYATDAYKQNLISEKEYVRISSLASNASPVFMLGVLGLSILGNIQYGYILIFSSLLSIFFISLILPSPRGKNFNPFEKKIKATPKLGIALQTSIENALKTTLLVCGYVITFSLIINILKNLTFIKDFFVIIENSFNLPASSLYGLFLGSIEVTNGCNLISQTNLSVHLKVSFMAFFCSFGGLSIIFQTSSFLLSNKISFLKYSVIKLVQGIIAFIIAFIASNLFINNIQTSITIATVNPYKYIFFICFLLFLPLLFLMIKKLLKVL
ncbi:sporulation integral membrane protein YlbJ [uncultured Clostridium sp.]|uniref:sporulation integral membrane protein YlbJ n=1 Tax=uncultured Clostridium sp. TaxID=59620 RepID=UPI0026337C8F|nr:sporulation integral membrane protein YlbJ [uncultured Clostridium sp.]